MLFSRFPSARLLIASVRARASKSDCSLKKKPAAGWSVLVAGTLLLSLVGGPHLFNFSLLGFCWAFSKIGCLTADEH